MKKFIGKSAAIAAAALLFAQTVPMVKVDAAGSNTLYIHSYKVDDNDYNTAKTSNAGSTGTTDDETMLTGLESKEKNAGRDYNIYNVSVTAGAYTVGSQIVSTASTDSEGQAVFSNLSDGIYWVDPVDSGVNAAFSNADGFFVQLPGASNEVHVYPKNTDNSGAKHTITFTKTGINDDTISGVKFNVYFKNAQDKWEKANLSDDDRTTDSNGQIKIENLPHGDYYFVEQAAPAGYLLDQTPKLVKVDGVNAPNETFRNEPLLTVAKAIDNDGAGNTYNWTITADLPENMDNLRSYTITDTYSNLNAITSSDVTVTGLTSGTDYTFANDANNSKFTITLTADGISKLKTNSATSIEVKVKSTKASAAGDGTEIKNKADISYEYAYNPDPSNDATPDIADIPDPDGVTTPEYSPDAHTYVYPIDNQTPDPNSDITLTVKDIVISNVDSNDTTKEISGAEYDIYTTGADPAKVNATSISDDSISKIATIAGGLAPGHYQLKQTKVGENYSLNTSPVDFYVGTDGKIYSNADCTTLFTSENGKECYITIQNTKAQFALPFTGTTATRVFTIAGICVMLAAGTFIFILLKKKDDDEDENKA